MRMEGVVCVCDRGQVRLHGACRCVWGNLPTTTRHLEVVGAFTGEVLGDSELEPKQRSVDNTAMDMRRVPDLSYCASAATNQLSTDSECADCGSPVLTAHSLHNQPPAALSAPLAARPLLWACLLALTLAGVAGFNVDARTAVVQAGPRGSMFGFAVAQHRDQGQNWLIVGAPKAQTAQEGITEAGAVFRCKADRPAACQMIPFDTRGNNIKWNGESFVTIEDKSYQWFGATVQSSGVNGVVVACAPRYVYFTREYNRREPVGNCFVLGGDTVPKAYSPCKLAASGYHRQGYCQAGMSAVLTADGQSLVMGAPGSFYWQGQIYKQDLLDFNDYFETSEAPPSHDDTYMGYAMGSGDFNQDGQTDFVVGIPKADDMRGKITVLDHELRSLYNASGEQLGEYFGSAIAVSDFNGDGLDDVAVGAPFYTNSYADAFENGRVYVFYQEEKPSFRAGVTHLQGAVKLRSRFGRALAALGDINDDTYNDLAVGAPYDGEDGKGAVYIFHGSSSGVLQTVSQVIYATDVSPGLSTFGYSISAGLDQDDNEYPDILVGAYESENAIFLRTRPIVRVNADFRIEPPLVDLSKPNCELQDGTKVVCFDIETCFSFSGKRVPRKLDFSFEWSLNAFEKRSPRSFFHGGTERLTSATVSETLKRNTRTCRTSVAYLKENFRDKLSPITAKLSYNLTLDPSPPPTELQPILDQYQAKVLIAQTSILKDCGPDNICIPDLAVQAKSMTRRHVLGTQTEVELLVQVTNQGEDSYETQVRVHLPPGVSYINVHKVESKLPVKCAAATAAAATATSEPEAAAQSGAEEPDNTAVTCDIGNPLPAGSLVFFSIRASATDVSSELDFMRFILKANSSNPENYTDITDNYAVVDIPVVAVTVIRLTGVSRPEQVLFNSSEAAVTPRHEAEAGPEVVHLYEVRNQGPSRVGALSVVVYWPLLLDGAHHFLYLPVMPQVVRGTGRCFTDSTINMYNLTVEERDFADLSAYEALRSRQKRDRSKRWFFNTNKKSTSTVKTLDCGSSMEQCALIRCEIGEMDQGESVLVQIHGRVWVNTITKLQASYRAYVVSSQAVAQVMEVPYKVPAEDYSVDTYQIETYIAALDLGQESEALKLWIIIVSIVGGCLLLLLLILLMWRCGFFTRLRPSDMEKEKLTQDGTNGVKTYTAVKTKPHKYDEIHNNDL